MLLEDREGKSFILDRSWLTLLLVIHVELSGSMCLTLMGVGGQSGLRLTFGSLSIEMMPKAMCWDWTPQREWVRRVQEGPDRRHSGM